MFEKIKELIVESLGIEEDQVTMEASFKEDLKVDSLDLFEMVMSLEDEFDVEIPTEELEKMETVGDVVEYIKEHKQAEGQRMKTVITELLGIEYPVIQGGMAWGWNSRACRRCFRSRWTWNHWCGRCTCFLGGRTDS